MSVEFRQRTPGEYAQILWQRKWLIVLPTIAVFLAVAYVVWRLPNVYESTTLLTVRPPAIPAVSANNPSNTLTMRINSIGQEVTSRSSLQPLIEKYNLYGQDAPMEVLVERMREKITVSEVVRNDITNAFRISFKGADAKVTQAVTAELAGKYVSGQTSAASNEAEQTKRFFEEQLTEAKAKLDAIEAQRLQYMRANIGNLPSENGALLGQLNTLSERQTSLVTEISRMRDQRNLMTGQLNDLRQQYQREQDDIVERVGDPKASSGYVQLVQTKARLEAELEDMLTVLKPKNPDVLRKQNEIKAVQREMDKMVEEGKIKTEEAIKKIKGRPNLSVRNFEANLQYLDKEIARREQEREQITRQIASIEQRINSVPGAEVQLEALNREYNTQKVFYDDLMTKSRNAEIAVRVNTNAQGETIAVIDAANLPESPIAPKRAVLMVLGLGLGLALGLLIAALFEVPRLLKIQTTEDVEHYTGLPVLISMPEMRTPKEERNLRLRHALLVTAGIAVTVVSIPALAYALKLSHIFDRFAM